MKFKSTEPLIEEQPDDLKSNSSDKKRHSSLKVTNNERLATQGMINNIRNQPLETIPESKSKRSSVLIRSGTANIDTTGIGSI